MSSSLSCLLLWSRSSKLQVWPSSFTASSLPSSSSQLTSPSDGCLHLPLSFFFLQLRGSKDHLALIPCCIFGIFLCFTSEVHHLTSLKMKIQCEVCEKAEAEVLCCSDEAVLCKPCDIKVHEANKLSKRHQRVALQKDAASGPPLCDICQERKGYFFCLEDRAMLCNDCDGAIHTCNSHQRFLLSGVQVSDQSLTENSGCNTSFSSETYQIHSKASLNSQYSSEETEAGNSDEINKYLL